MLTEGSPAGPLSLAEFGALLASLARLEDPPFLAVAVSGGPDSLALAILAHRWASESGGAICALSVDHRLRPESDAEMRQLRAWLSARGIRHEVLVWSGEKPRTGIQEAARIARYRLLSGWCREHGCLHLLTAHQCEDQVETHLIRSRAHSGADGLAGMSAIRELDGCRLLRPLLGVPKNRLRAFLEAEGQPFISDPSNLDPAFERTRYRNGDGSPASGAAGSALHDRIRKLGFARVARESERNQLLARYVSVHPAGFALLDPRGVSESSPDMTERLLAATAATISGDPYPPRRERIARLRGRLGSGAARGSTIGGCRFIRWRECVLTIRELARAAPPIRLAPGNSTLWDRRFAVIMPQGGSGLFTIGYLDLAGVSQLNRVAPQLRRGHLPRLILPILPALWDEDGIAAVPHLGYRREGLDALPQIVFHPVNPLTQTGFAVV